MPRVAVRIGTWVGFRVRARVRVRDRDRVRVRSLSSRYERMEPSLSADQLPIVSAELAELRTWLRVGLGIGVGLGVGVGVGYTVQG